MTPNTTKCALLLAGALPLSTIHAAEEAGPGAADYEAAARLLEGNLRGLVRNESVAPHWLGDSGWFWYLRDGAEGKEYVVTEVATGRRVEAFHHPSLADALSAALSEPVSAADLGLTAVTISEDLSQLSAMAQGQQVECDLEAMLCTAADPAAVDPGLLSSPGGVWGVRTDSDNLVLVNLASSEERPLTEDGAPYYSWGKLPDTSLITIPVRRSRRVLPPYAATFSPDDRFLIVPRLDERNVAVNPFVEWVPVDGSLRPIVHEIRSPFTGDSSRPVSELFVFDLETGAKNRVQVPPEYADGLDPTPMGWSVSRGQAFMLAGTYGRKKVALIRVDLASGQGTVLLEETSDTRVENNSYMYNWPNVRLLGDGRELIWYADRSGWGHLYLYDAQSGELKNTITEGNWLVQDIHAVDEEQRQLYFTAGGREQGRDPYYRHLYRVSLSGGLPTLLTDNDADHHFAPTPSPMFALLFGTGPEEPLIRPDLGVFIDTFSTVDTPPVTLLRSTSDGAIIATLEEADASALYEAGWQAPVRQSVKAADGETDIWTVYWAPQRNVPGGKHPVIDSVYGGPQVIVAPRNFIEAYSGRNPVGQAAQARLGFAVVTTDARGTPLRSNAYRDVGYPNFTQIGIDDHVAAIEQLAQRYPEMDTSRVGIHGWSWGGTFSGQAILSRPDFYDVSVTGAGVYDYAPLYPGFESTTGIPVYSDGSSTRPTPSDKPLSWEDLDITAMAGNLKGKMMIVYGDADENVPPSQAFRLIDALIKAGKPYDLLYIPNGTHGSTSGGLNAYTMQRRWDYFVEHLFGAEPPADVTISYQ